MKGLFLTVWIFLLVVPLVQAGRAPIQTIARDPYAAALVMDAESGKILFAENADVQVYPASVLKLMDLLIILERIEQRTVRLSDMVQVTREAYRMGGSQVYLDPKEQFSVEELLYALMVQSANDAAVALAIHVAGSQKEFVALMNQKAKALGMKDTSFHSVHGLPPAEGQQPDVTTAGDFAILCRELAKHPDVFTYTATRVRGFRQDQFIMRTHNHLLDKVVGCDGFKTGYFQAAGFSIAATARRGGVRIIAVVMGSRDRKVRDAQATELLAKGFAALPPKPAVAVRATPAPKPLSSKEEAALPIKAVSTDTEETGAVRVQAEDCGWGRFFLGMGSGMVLCALLLLVVLRKSKRDSRRYIRPSPRR